MSDCQRALESYLNVRIVSQHRISGGDFAESQCVELSDGSTLFVKTHANPPAHFFSTEAAGLIWLRETHSVPIPKVVFVSDEPPCLAMQWVDEGPRVSQGEQTLGTQLAELHCSHFPQFGRPDSRTTGSLAVPNPPLDNWVNFYRDCRLTLLLEISEQRSALPARTLKRVHTLCERLDNFAPDETTPSLVHGDLWAGNRIVDTHGKSWLIDPAAHGNHREFDIGMMHLFGGYDQQCFDAYNEAFPLGYGWQDRIPLFQLAPLIVHAIKFGGHYADATHQAVSRFVD